MEHSISNLNECIVDYLALNNDRPRSTYEIYNDISGDSGVRCPALRDPLTRDRYRLRFINTCYTIDNKYHFVKKLYRGNQLYLVYDKENKWNSWNDWSSIVNEPKASDDWFDYANDAVNYLFEDFKYDYFEPDYYYNRRYDYRDPLLHYLVRYGFYKRVNDLLDTVTTIDIYARNNNGETPLDLAIENKDTRMIERLMEYKYATRIFDLERKVDELTEELTRKNHESVSSRRSSNPTRLFQETPENGSDFRGGLGNHSIGQRFGRGVNTCNRIAKYLGYGVMVATSFYIYTLF